MKPFYKTCWIILRIFLRLYCRLRTTGTENIPTEGGVIIASNHIAGADPPFLGTCIKREFYFMAKKELFRNFILRKLISNLNAIPVDRGVFDRRALERSEEVLRKDYGLIMFPEGTRSKTGELGRARPGIGMLAHRTLVPIVPAYIRNSKGFHKLLFNGGRMEISFGEPITPAWIAVVPDSKDGYRAIADEVMRRIKLLKSAAESDGQEKPNNIAKKTIAAD